MFIVLPRRPRRPQKTPKAPKGPQKVPKGPPKAPRVQCMNSRSYFCSAKPKLLFYFYIRGFREEKNKYQVSRLKKRSKKFRETENEFIKKWLQPNFILFTSTSKWHNFKKLMIIFLDQSESFWLFERKKVFHKNLSFSVFLLFLFREKKTKQRKKFEGAKIRFVRIKLFNGKNVEPSFFWEIFWKWYFFSHAGIKL